MPGGGTKNRFNHNTPSPLRGTSPILGEELFVVVNNELDALNSSPPGAGGVAQRAEGVEIIFKVQCYGESGRTKNWVPSLSAAPDISAFSSLLFPFSIILCKFVL